MDNPEINATINSNTLFEHKDSWQTPPYLFETLHKEFCFGLDLCASHSNAILSNYLTKEDNALQSWRNWHTLAHKRPVWCNPPYSRGNIPAFMTEAKRQADENGATTVFLVPADTAASWFPFDDAKEIRFIRGGRIAFVHAGTGRVISGNTKGSAICVFGPKTGNYPAALSSVKRSDLIEAA
ncbi:phage N-6-adenine-methyltransferase [Photobacterium damselae]|uniref:phage N-6-adenine-methyltransferase n=1 Tax=Photobacterium damselae TaxID=38293 RepID=UPI001EEDB1DB|nr:phage N-6-adenine-methyltransferase [Photobacterium damselae]UKA12947.1 phage N-6-adenine-methyltransferase [Photobacterium damselae subsp. damselae]